MHAKHLAAIASWAAFHSSSLIYGENSQSVFAANKYWTESKCRLQRWMRALRMFESDIASGDSKHDPWPAIEIVVEEILLSELLTRVWSAAMASHDKQHETDEMIGVAHSTHIGQVEARNRALRLIVSSKESDPAAFERMNILRRKIERWTDMLLGQLPDVQIAMDFGFQENRVKDYSFERQQSTDTERRQQHPVFTAALVRDLEQSCNRYPANPASNREIAAGVLACFSSDRFDSNGLPKSAQMLWMEKNGSDSQLLVDHLVELDSDTSVSSIGTGRI